jgi:hypothetical protein
MPLCTTRRQRHHLFTETLFSTGAALVLLVAACSDDGGPAFIPSTTSGATGGASTNAATTATAGGSSGSTGTGQGGTSGTSDTGTAGGAGMGGSGGTGGAGGSSQTAGGGGVAGAGGAAGGGGMAGAAGAPDGGSPTSCITSGSELCDDFESGMLDMQKWKINKPTGSASVTVDKVHAHGGQYAVHVKVVAGQQSTAMIGESVTFPSTSNSFYSRMFVYFSPDIPVAANADYHTGFMIGSGNNNLGNVQAGMGMIGSAKQYLGYSIFYGNPKYEFGPWSKTLIVPNEWVCIELFENGSDPMTEVRQVWVNDTELTDLRSNSAMSGGTQNPNHLPPKFDTAWFGLWEYHPIPTLSDMWIDDVRVSSKKIGCAN